MRVSNSIEEIGVLLMMGELDGLIDRICGKLRHNEVLTHAHGSQVTFFVRLDPHEMQSLANAAPTLYGPIISAKNTNKGIVSHKFGVNARFFYKLDKFNAAEVAHRKRRPLIKMVDGDLAHFSARVLCDVHKKCQQMYQVNRSMHYQ